jgi:hypothetical protein
MLCCLPGLIEIGRTIIVMVVEVGQCCAACPA